MLNLGRLLLLARAFTGRWDFARSPSQADGRVLPELYKQKERIRENPKNEKRFGVGGRKKKCLLP